MRIDLLCNDGSPIGVIPPLIYGRGVGGAELAMMSLMHTFADRGHEVRVFNDPSSPGDYDGVHYQPLAAWDNRSPRDALIIFRSPNHRVRFEDLSGVRRVWWSTDQYTVGDYAALAGQVEFCVTISPHHTDYHRKNYGIAREKIGHIDLGVRLSDYAAGVEKVKNRLIFCSIPDRGLTVLHASWPLIKKVVPDASLVITSDYRLWGTGTANNQTHRLMWAGQPDVKFLGRVDRLDLTRYQQEAEILSYPCLYDELFCLSVAECQVAGTLPITTDAGALPTTNEYGILIPGEPTRPAWVTQFVERITVLLTTERLYLEERQRAAARGGRLRFDWNVIAEQWEHLLDKGRLDR
jgi:glycosyltransferase involved in cell wall biosynthesis